MSQTVELDTIGAVVYHNNVLFISNPEDIHVHAVVNKIDELGANPILFFPERLGQSGFLSIGFNPKIQEQYYSLTIEASIIDLRNVHSVWYRRPRLVSLDEYKLSREALDFARDEWRAALEGIHALLGHVLWVSHPDRLREAARKPLQLKLANELGLSVPNTLITNNPDDAQRFVSNCTSKVIVKATGAGWVYAQNEEDVTFVMTNRLSESNLETIDDIKIAPVTFQEEIAKAYEVRANIVGCEILAIKIDSQKSKISQVDWRRYDVENTPYTPYQLPRFVEQSCLKLTQKLGLEFGAIDLIRKPDGEYVFLEINGNGQFLWAEELSGVKVSDAIARLLSGVAPSLSSACLD